MRLLDLRCPHPMVSSMADRSSSARLLRDQDAAGAKVGRQRSSLAIWFLALFTILPMIFLMSRPGLQPLGPKRNYRPPDILVPKYPEHYRHATEGPNEEQTTDKEELSKRASNRGFLIFTTGCKIPDLDPLDPAVRKYVKFYALDTDDHSDKEDSEKVRPDCSGKFGPALVESNLTSLYMVPSALSHYNVTKLSDIHCCYRPFHRVLADPIKYKTNCDDLSEYSKECFPFGEDGTANVGGKEFVRVECRNESVQDPKAPMLYKDFHFFAPVTLARRRAEEQKAELNITKVMKDPEGDKWNVLILGIDAVSRLNFHRQLTKTKEALENIGAVELLGFNKVGDNTFPNIVTLMSGMLEEDLKPLCWPNSKTKLDDCPWIWYNFTEAGYLTALAEDVTWMSTFNYAKTGFLKEPVHFYHRPFGNVAEQENGHLKRMNAKVCVGPRLAANMIFGYAEKIMNTLKRVPDPPPFFGHFWTNSLSHDFLNSAGYLDDPVSALIKRLKAAGTLEKTVLIFISDHGIRWGGIRSTYQGRLEERLPVAYVSLPQSMRQKYPSAAANLVRNARKRLTSPFDLHATMLDIINSEDAMPQEAVSRRSRVLPASPPKVNETSGLPRGVSLFLPIPEWRTCDIAGISPNWCSCHAGERALDARDPLASEAAGVLIEKVNQLVEAYPQCAKRNLVGINSAMMSAPPEILRPNKGQQVLQDLSLIVESNPGSALFEATVRLTPTNASGRGNTMFDMAVVGMISRINRYGNQSSCVDEFHAKLYCYCGS